MTIDLDEIDDDEIESTLFDLVRKENFSHGLPVLYKNHENDDLYILEFPDGSKKTLTHDDLKKLNEES